MDWILEKLFDYAAASKSSLLMAYAVYLIIAALIISNIAKNQFSWKAYMKIPRWGCHVVLLFLLPAAGISLVLGFPGLSAGCRFFFVGGIAVVFLALAASLRFGKSGERRRMDHAYKTEGNPIERYRRLMEIRQDRLTPKEQKLWKKRLYFTYYEMGSLKQAETLMRETEPEDSPRFLMVQSILKENAGDLKGAQELMQKAWGDSSVRTEDHSLWVQILNNLGRTYRISGNFRESLTYYKQAVDELRLPEEEKLAESVYTNYIFTLSLLHYSWEAIEEALKEYESRLDLTKPENRGVCMNLRITAAKQCGRPDIWKRLIEDGFDEIMTMALPEEQRLIFEATSLRLAYTGGVNYIAPLDAIRKDLNSFFKLKMPARYLMIKEIHILFRAESGIPPQILDLYGEVGAAASSYIREQAVSDIRQYLDSLPAEAVAERCTMQTELAGIMRYQKEYSLEKCRELLLSVRDTYETNGLLLDAARVSIHLADEHFAAVNLDKDLMPKARESLKEAMQYAERLVERMQLHPEIAEVFAQIAWMYVRLHQYESSTKYISLYQKMELSEMHFAPWFRSQMTAVQLIDRVLRRKRRIEELCGNPERMQDLSPQAREWLRQYPKVNSLDMTLLWGGLLGMETVFIKYRLWMGVTPNGVGMKVHHWLCIPEILDEKQRIAATLLELDMAYLNLEETNEERMLFLPGLHPLESGRSVRLRKDQEAAQMVVPVMQQRILAFPHKDAEGNATVLEEVCQAVLL